MTHAVLRALRGLLLTLGFVLAFATAATAQERAAQERTANAPGRFDFYVLALSWSPSYCASVKERGDERSTRASAMQCGARPYSFVVHGLWPQYERGFPSSCQRPAPRIDRGLVDSMLDLMPSPRLIFHEWDRHGTCSGLSQHAYFEAVRKARAVVKIPLEFTELDKPITVKPDDVAEAFVKANAGLSRADFAVACDSKRLSEVRVCLNKDFSFRACGDVARRACKRDSIAMPAVRG
jgi:ribonuclease T2